MTLQYLLYLLYGLAFFTLGVAILSRDIRLSELGIARIIWLLALFGIIHGFHEWLEFLQHLSPELVSPRFTLIRLLVVGSSFLFLFYYGLFLVLISNFGDKALQATPLRIKITVALGALSLLFYTLWHDLPTGHDIITRMLLAFPAALLSGVGMIVYSRTVRPFSSRVATNFILAGFFMCVYAVVTGIVPSEADVPILELPIILVRGFCAVMIMIFTIRGLSVFSLEQRQLINDQLLRFSQSEKLTSMGILATGIAHEINNPLTNVSLNVELLKDRLAQDERGLKKLEAIERNVQRASRIARELLHFSSEKETALQPTSLNEVISSSIHLVKNQPLGSIIESQLQEVSLIRAIPWKLEEVFINLLMNSLDACGPEDTILVESLEEPNGIRVVITDTGHGISQEDLHKVFDPFFTTKEVGKGTGLGLAVCYNIIKQHGATIDIASSKGGGTVVNLLFPRAQNGP